MTEKAPERFSTYNVMMTAESGKYIPSPDGKWVRFADYATLTAERDALAAEVERIEGERDAALDTLKAWFDRRKLAHEAIDETVLDAVRGYLRTSRSGGMDQKTSDMIENVIADMARLSVFADLFARAALEEGKDG